LQNRVTKGNDEHEQSSRSHALLEIEIISDEVKLLSIELEKRKVERQLTHQKLTEQEVNEQSTVIYNLMREHYNWPEMTIEEMKIKIGKFSTFAKEYPDIPQKMEDAFINTSVEVKLLQDAKEKADQNLIDAKNHIIHAKKNQKVKNGKLVIVDLAGTEFSDTNKTRDPKALKEFKEIAKSLLSLKECIRKI